MDSPNVRLVLPIIALVESLFVLEKKSQRFSLDERSLLSALNKDERIQIIPLSQNIVELTLKCKAVTGIHDRLIVATALSFEQLGDEVVLLTADENIQESGVIATKW